MDDAAATFAKAVEAADFTFHARLDTADRIDEIQRSGNLTRWASFAIARAGDNEGAALTLENGLTRELRRRLGVGVEEDQLTQLPSEARGDYRGGSRRAVCSSFRRRVTGSCSSFPTSRDCDSRPAWPRGFRHRAPS